jgi:endonuclease VIII
MPEGDTVWLSAKNLDAALGGELLTVCDLRVPAFATVDLSGEVIDEVVSRGKHLLHRIGDFTIHSHLKMEGSWHLYHHETPWRRPAWSARAVLETAEWVSVGFMLGELDVVPREQEHTIVGHLGPDLLGADWDADLAIANITAQPDVPIYVALLDQRNLAGLGNEYANELCFLRGVLPTRPVSTVDVPAFVAMGFRLINANKERSIRATTGDLRPGKQTWVYPRAGSPCRRCGTRIRRGKLGPTPLIQRDTFWCPRCQT